MGVVHHYETDYFAWLMNHAQLLRDGRLDELDRQQLAEEMETMGKREQRALLSRLSVLLAHLLKWQWQYQPQRRSRRWMTTIKTQRMDIQD